MKKVTIKSLVESILYIVSFILKGNAKLKDYDNEETGEQFRYAQFNLPAKKTCPYATVDCKKFCYAKRDERYTSVRKNRKKSLEYSKRENFAAMMIHTIETAFHMKRYNGKTMILRIHESGDFYSLAYLQKWVAVFHEYETTMHSIIFCFYTKCFEFLLSMTDDEKAIFRRVTDSGLCSVSLSIDESTTKEQLALAMEVKKLFPAVNIYFAIPADKIGTIKYDEKCDCADCAKCGTCVHANGKTVACPIH